MAKTGQKPDPVARMQMLVSADIACTIELQELSDIVLQSSPNGLGNFFQGEQQKQFNQKMKVAIKSRYELLQDSRRLEKEEEREQLEYGPRDEAEDNGDVNYTYQLYPGRMGLKDLEHCPPTLMFTSEYDFLRGDTMYFI